MRVRKWILTAMHRNGPGPYDLRFACQAVETRRRWPWKPPAFDLERWGNENPGCVLLSITEVT